MKKTLLLLTVLGTAALPAMADVEPTYFNLEKLSLENVYDYPLDQVVRDDLRGAAQANLGGGWRTNNGEGFGSSLKATDYDNGIIVIGGAGAFNANSDEIPRQNRALIKQGITIQNLGDQIGNVLVINGKNSDLANTIKDKLGLQEAPHIPQMGYDNGGSGNLMLYFLIPNTGDGKLTDKSGGFLGVRLKFSLYKNSDNSTNEAFSILHYNDGGQGIGASGAGIQPFYQPSIKWEDMEIEDQELSLTNWLTYSCSYPFSSPGLIKVQIPYNFLTEGAILIKKVEILKFPGAGWGPSIDEGTVTAADGRIIDKGSGLTKYKISKAEDCKVDLAMNGKKYDSNKLYVGESFNATVNPITADYSLTSKYVSFENGIYTAIESNDLNEKLDIFDVVNGVTLTNPHADNFELSHGEEVDVEYKLEATGGKLDVKFEATGSDHVTFTHKEGKLTANVTGNAKGNATLTFTVTGERAVKDGKAEAKLELTHYAAPKGITIAQNFTGDHLDVKAEQERSSQAAYTLEGGTFTPRIHADVNSIGTEDEEAYQGFKCVVVENESLIDVTTNEDGTLTIGKATNGETSLKIKVKALGAHAAKSASNSKSATNSVVEIATFDAQADVENASNPIENTERTYLVVLNSVGLSGIGNVAVDAVEGEAQLFNLQGVRVADPAPGVYIRRAANGTTEKVIIR